MDTSQTQVYSTWWQLIYDSDLKKICHRSTSSDKQWIGQIIYLRQFLFYRKCLLEAIYSNINVTADVTVVFWAISSLKMSALLSRISQHSNLLQESVLNVG